MFHLTADKLIPFLHLYCCATDTLPSTVCLEFSHPDLHRRKWARIHWLVVFFSSRKEKKADTKQICWRFSLFTFVSSEIEILVLPTCGCSQTTYTIQPFFLFSSPNSSVFTMLITIIFLRVLLAIIRFSSTDWLAFSVVCVFLQSHLSPHYNAHHCVPDNNRKYVRSFWPKVWKHPTHPVLWVRSLWK